MNDTLKKFAKEELKKGLMQCTEAQQRLFKQMYAPKNIDKDIDYAINNIPDEKLDWAMMQVERTLARK